MLDLMDFHFSIFQNYECYEKLIIQDLSRCIYLHVHYHVYKQLSPPNKRYTQKLDYF